MDDAGHFCRLCAEAREDLVQVFSENGCRRRIVDKIHIHLPIQITAEDCLPTSVCERCLESLEISHNLLEVCLDADSKLRKILHLPEDPSHLATLTELKASVGLSCKSYLPTQENPSTHLINNDRLGLDQAVETNINDLPHVSPKVGSSDGSDFVFHCLECPEKFQEHDLLLQHRIKDHYSGGHHVCSICGEHVQNFESYVNHLCTHFNEVDFDWECGNCGCSILSKEALKQHVNDKCDIKQKIVSKGSSSCIIPNIECKDENEPFLCQKCCSKFQCKKDLDLHAKKHHTLSNNVKKSTSKGKRGVECRVCGKTFESFWYMTRHRNEDHNKEEVALALHRLGLDREKYECNVCGKLLSCHFTYKHHLQAHDGIRNHQCPHCGRCFVYLAQLNSHMLVHSGGPHACSTCSKKFPNAFALRVHVRTHTGERPFQCEHCPKAFHSRANYEQHVIIHTDKRKYQCHLCPYRARRPEALRTHIRVHTNERPYACKVCERAFKQKYDCTKHERLHAKRPPGVLLKAGVVKSDHPNLKTPVTIHKGPLSEPSCSFESMDVKENDNDKSNVKSICSNIQAVEPKVNNQTASRTSTPHDRTTKEDVQEIFVAFEEASEQCTYSVLEHIINP